MQDIYWSRIWLKSY